MSLGTFTDLAVKKGLSIMHTSFIKVFSKGVTIKKGGLVYYRTRIMNYSKNGSISIGENSRIGCSSKRYHAGLPFYARILIDGIDSKVVIGNNCRLNGAYIHAEKSITIGNNCVAASGVHIMDSNAHMVYSLDRTIGRDEPEEITIGDNVWIGLNSIILKGVVIGNNCVISAGSVVKGKFPNNVIIAGNPATIVNRIDLKKNDNNTTNNG